MTVPNTTRLKEYAGDDALVAFSYPFRIFEASHLIVTLIVDATGVETVKTETTHYTLDGVSVPSGGTVTMLAAPATGETLRLERVVPLTQIHDLRNQGTFVPQSTEDALDRIVMMVQSAFVQLTITINDIIEQGGIPEYTRATRPVASAFWKDKLIIVRDVGLGSSLQRCIENATDDSYDWSEENVGGWA